MFADMQDTKLEETSLCVAAPRVLTVNGQARPSVAATLSQLLADLGYGGDRVATAVNGDFVPERLRSVCTIAEGDQIEIVAPRQGG